MAKFSDLDPNHKATLAINLHALDLASKILHDVTHGNITFPKQHSAQQWVEILHQTTLEMNEFDQESIDEFCQFLDQQISEGASSSNADFKLVTRKQSYKSNRN